jgi:hypothetical protein
MLFITPSDFVFLRAAFLLFAYLLVTFVVWELFTGWSFSFDLEVYERKTESREYWAVVAGQLVVAGFFVAAMFFPKLAELYERWYD